MKDKYIKIYILLLIIVCGCTNNDSIDNKDKRNENWVWWIDKQTSIGKWIPFSNENTVKDGKYTLFFFNGKVMEIGKVKNGKNTDTAIVYDTQGKLIEYRIYERDTVVHYYPNDGIYQSFYNKGELCQKGLVKNHKPISEWTTYLKNGGKSSIEIIKGDISLCIRYFDNGQIWDSISWFKGTPNGRLKRWYKNGKLEEISFWKNGIQNGDYTIFFENGNLKQSATWNNGRRNGKRETWFENGNKEFSAFDKNDSLEGEVFTWYSNGILKQKGNYKNGKTEGEQFSYHENGELRSKGFCERGKQVGEWLWYDDKFEMIQKDTYKDGQLINAAKY